MIVHEKLEKQEKKQEIQDEEVEEQEKALEKQLTAKVGQIVSDQIAVFAVDINKKKEEFMPTKSKKRNKGWSVTEAFSRYISRKLYHMYLHLFYSTNKLH